MTPIADPIPEPRRHALARTLAVAAVLVASQPAVPATLMIIFALTSGVWFLWAMGYHLSIATGVGFIALAGVAASEDVVHDAIREGAVLRVRPKAMTVAVILAGLLPIVWGSGTGSEVMSRIAAPMLGGMITAPLLSLFVVPTVYALMRGPRGARAPRPAAVSAGPAAPG